MRPSVPKASTKHLLFAAFLIAYAVLLIRTAWMCDDAFITLRTVDNFVRGHGLMWNLGERVQVYTHPLWLFVLAGPYALTREPFYTTLAVSMTLSMAAALLLLWRSRHSAIKLALVGLVLVGSKAFVDYSTSGLENPLSYLLLTACWWFFLDKQSSQRANLLLASLMSGLLMLNRLDLALMVMPVLAFAIARAQRWVAWRMAIVALLPAVGWMLFSLIYYGFPLPNTFYAKQSIGIPRSEYLERGLGYLLETTVTDSMTSLGIVMGLIAAIWQRRGEFFAAALGIVLYVCYVVWIGGDFMGGRMLSVPLAGALSLLAAVKDTQGVHSLIGAARRRLLNSKSGSHRWAKTLPLPIRGSAPSCERPCARIPIASGVALIACAGTFAASHPYLFNDPPLRGVFNGSGVKRPIGTVADFGIYHIADERAHYHALWLLPALRGETDPSRFERAEHGRALAKDGISFHVFTLIGVLGYYAGQGVEIIDPLALSDAFLARIGLQSYPPNWRLAHIERPLPDGYLLTRFSGVNQIRDPELARRYEQLRLLTSGPIFAPQRLRAMLELNARPPLFAKLDAHRETRRDYYRLFFHPKGLGLNGQDLNVIFPKSLSAHRLFVRASGGYRLELRANRGRDLRTSHIVSDDKLLAVPLEKVDAVRLVPLGSDPVTVRYVLASPAATEEIRPIHSPSVQFNLYRPEIPAWLIVDPAREPLWLTQPALPLLLKVAERRAHVLQVTAFPLCASGKAQTLRLWLNGELLAAHQWANCGSGFGARWETAIALSPRQLLQGWNLLEVEAEYGVVLADVVPETGDSRTMYVGFERLWLEPAR
jgi:arabinofuranosyltransferase